jgi:TonB family protein
MIRIVRPAALLRAAVLAAALLLPAAAPPPAAEPPQRARSATNLATLFSDEDYPAAAIRNHEQGPVAFRLEVGADGRPAGCTVTGSSGSSILDSTTCRLLVARARFQPARDAQGKPTADSFNGRIIWRLPDISPRLDTLRNLWNGCVLGEVAKRVPGDLAADEVARLSFPPCAALEALLARELDSPLPLEEPRASIRLMIEAGLAEARAALNAPSPPATPDD